MPQSPAYVVYSVYTVGNAKFVRDKAPLRKVRMSEKPMGVVVILGPTASGKIALRHSLAQVEK